jgi:hypothetical protein
MILMPYFLSNAFTAAITTEAQSVSGMKPIRTSFFSGASEPAAQAPPARKPGTPGGTMPISAAPPTASEVFLRKSRRVIPESMSLSSMSCSTFPKKWASHPRRRGEDSANGRPCPKSAGSPLTRCLPSYLQSACQALAIHRKAALSLAFR